LKFLPGICLATITLRVENYIYKLILDNFEISFHHSGIKSEVIHSEHG